MEKGVHKPINYYFNINLSYSCIILFLVIIFSLSSVSAANVIYVNDTSGDDNNDGSDWNHAKKTLLNATGSVDTNGTINMAHGTYNGVGNTQITINKNMSIIGESGTYNYENAKIDGSASTGIFKINSDVYVNLTNIYFFRASSSEGSAINNSGHLNIQNCTFDSNYASNRGGAILNWGNLTINNTIFQKNTALNDGGSIFNIGNMTIEKCNFTENSVVAYGGAIYLDTSSIHNVHDSTFNMCSAYGGGAIYIGSASSIGHCTFLSNNAIKGGAIYTTGTSVLMSRFYNNQANEDGNAIYSESWIWCGYNWWGSNNPNFNTLVYSDINMVLGNDSWIYVVLDANNKSIVSRDTSQITLNFNYFFNGTNLTYNAPMSDSIFNNIPITFNLNGNGTLNPIPAVINNGIALTNFRATYPGISTITTQFDDQTFELSINVFKSNSTLTLHPAIGSYHDLTAFVISLIDQLGQFSDANIKFYLNDVLIGNSTTIYEGVAVLPYYINLNASNIPYTIKAVFEGDDFHNAAENVNEFYVNPANINLSLNPVNTTYNGLVNLTANLVDKLGNRIAHQIVKFYINGQMIGNATTGYDGLATIHYMVNLSPSSSPYTITAEYSGNQNYETNIATNTLTINKTSTKLSIDNIIANKGSVVKLTAILKDIYNRPLSNQIVSFEVNGVIIGSTLTNNQGIANKAYKVNLNGGKYIIKTKLGTNANYMGSTALSVLRVPQAYLIQKTSSSIKKPKLNQKFNVYYKLTNKGPDAAKNTIITLKLPKYFKLSKITGKSWKYNKKTRTIKWISTKLTKTRIMLKITGKIIKKGTYRFKSSIKSTTYHKQDLSPLKIKVKK